MLEVAGAAVIVRQNVGLTMSILGGKYKGTYIFSSLPATFIISFFRP